MPDYDNKHIYFCLFHLKVNLFWTAQAEYISSSDLGRKIILITWTFFFFDVRHVTNFHLLLNLIKGACLIFFFNFFSSFRDLVSQESSYFGHNSSQISQAEMCMNENTLG